MFGRRVSTRTFDQTHPKPILGIDEVGTGAIAGGIFACGVVLPDDPTVWTALQRLKVRDSKDIMPEARERMFEQIVALPGIEWWVSSRSPREIYDFGHHECIASLFNEIVDVLWLGKGSILIDGVQNAGVVATAHWIKKGDQKSLTIGTASVLAKVTRDRAMVYEGARYPGYGFEEHKGYYTPGHQEALERLGPCAIHRENTEPVREARSRRSSSPSEAESASPEASPSEGPAPSPEG